MTIFGDPLWSELLSISNIIFGLIIAYASIRRRRHFCGFMRAGVTLLSIAGLYWTILYVFVLFTPGGAVDPVWFGRIFVRPAFTFTLWVVAGLAMYRYRTKDRPECDSG